MMEADEIAVTVKQAETAFAAQQKVIETEKKELVTELAGVEKTLAETTAARTALFETLDKRVIALSDQIATVRKGIALSQAPRDGLCSVCHVRLRPPVFQVLRTNDQITQCDSCNRILYYIPPPPPVDMPVVRTGPA
jgi:predicted  nucleic acid-binding Zn-ribbon protein